MLKGYKPILYGILRNTDARYSSVSHKVSVFTDIAFHDENELRYLKNLEFKGFLKLTITRSTQEWAHPLTVLVEVKPAFWKWAETSPEKIAKIHLLRHIYEAKQAAVVNFEERCEKELRIQLCEYSLASFEVYIGKVKV